MSQLPEDLDRLSPEQRRELLAKLLARRARQSSNLAPCSHGQRSLWFMHQLAPSSPVYNVAMGWRVRSAVDVDALRRAFQAIADRHESLRTTYESRDGEPWQRIHETLPIAFEARPVGPLSDDEMRDLLTAEAAPPFNLETGPLVRVRLFTRGDADHVLLLTIHHIACDLWSLEHVLDDLRVLYDRECGATDVVVPAAPPTKYADYSRWQRAMLDGAEGAAHWDYWRTKLRGDLPRLELPTDRVRPAVQSFAGANVRFSIPAELLDGLRSLAAAERTTLFTVFLAAFETLLARNTGQTEVLVGSPASGRSRSEFEPIVGYFVNPIVFRGNLSDDPSFRELIGRTRGDVLSSIDHQDFPFPLLVERLNVGRDVSRSPIADAYFVWDKVRERGGSDPETGSHVRLEWNRLSLETFHLAPTVTPSDLAVLVWELGQSITVNLGFSTELFDRSTIERFGEQFVELLGAAVANPDLPVSRLTLASNVERERLLATPAARTFPPRGSALDTLHGRFEEQARRRPDAVAVSGASRQLTYAELNSRANALAARLRAAGAERGSLVALFVERDVEMVVAALAILKTGSAYLPIDPMYPRGRAAFMLDDASARILVTRRGMDDSFAPTDVARVFVDEQDEDSLNAPIDAGAAAGDLAYVIYTSGSTGKPKGVMVTHHNVTRLFDATAHWYEFSENDVWSLFHSIAFDWSVWELWGALLHGGRVVVVPHATTRSPEDMLDLLRRERVTMLGQTPSAFRQLVAADAARAAIEPLSLRFVIFGGEALDVNMLRPWITRRGDQYPRLVNMFGITETTVHVTFRPITERDLDRRVRSPIGEPIPDLRLLVLDSARQPVPVGVPGELVVGGDGVARGYLNRPELTASRFIPDPASSDPAARLYRSGDLARRLPDGDIEYLGRIDQQVKIRGFRIELGEIESTLARHPAVEQCAVIVRNDAADDPRIVAYVVPRAGAAASAAEILGFVRASLPDYMVPSTIVTLASLPLTANHKLDVAALPRPERTESASLRPYVAPATEIETAIAAAWSRLLGVERVGVDDDFFELGGHSIMATALTGWLREHFRVAFPVYAIFESPTVRGMADRVQALAADAAEPRIESPREEFEL